MGPHRQFHLLPLKSRRRVEYLEDGGAVTVMCEGRFALPV
jgi:hypothetical protein